MAFYPDPLRRTGFPQIQTGTPISSGGQYLQVPESQAPASQALGFPGGVRGSYSGISRAATFPAQHSMAGQQYMQPQYVPQTAPQTAAVYGTSPAAQYIAATQAAAAQQAGLAGHNPYAAAQPGMVGAGVPIPGAYNTGAPAHGAYSYPGTAGQYYGGHAQHGDVLPPPHHNRPHHHRRKHKKSRIRKIVEELLAGGAAVAAAHHEEKKHSHNRENSETQQNSPNAPNVEHPPKGAAPGFLHPKGHFVPAAIDDLANHFLHRKGDLAPEGSQPGYLHSGGHFVPLAIEALIGEFAYTLLKEHRRHRGRSHTPVGRRHHDTRSADSSSENGSDYSDSGSETSSSSDGNYRRHRR